MTTAPHAPDQRPGTAATAADEGQHVAGVAADEARSVVNDARDQAQQLIDETLQQVNEHGSEQRDRLVELLRGLSNDLHEMATSASSSGVATSLVRQGADQADALGKRLDGHDLTDLVDEVRVFARRRPGTFLLVALAAGVVAGRFARSAKAAHDEPDTATASGSTTSTPVPPGDSLAPGTPTDRVAVPAGTHLDPSGISTIPGSAGERS